MMLTLHEAPFALAAQLIARTVNGIAPRVTDVRCFPYPSGCGRLVLVSAEIDGDDDVQVLFELPSPIDPVDREAIRKVEAQFTAADPSRVLH